MFLFSLTLLLVSSELAKQELSASVPSFRLLTTPFATFFHITLFAWVTIMLAQAFLHHKRFKTHCTVLCSNTTMAKPQKKNRILQEQRKIHCNEILHITITVHRFSIKLLLCLNLHTQLIMPLNELQYMKITKLLCAMCCAV